MLLLEPILCCLGRVLLVIFHDGIPIYVSGLGMRRGITNAGEWALLNNIKQNKQQKLPRKGKP